MEQHICRDRGELLRVSFTELHAAIVPVGGPTSDDMAEEYHLELVQSFRQSCGCVMAGEAFYLAFIVDHQLAINPNLL